jgi:ParB-like chromosome segregation protein Spo0J
MGGVIVDVEISTLLPGPIETSKVHLDPERVAWYVEHLDVAEPVTVFRLDEGLLLADGHHRVEAARRLGRSRIKALVRTGTREDALAFAVDLAREQRGLSADVAVAAIKRRSGGSWGAA